MSRRPKKNRGRKDGKRSGSNLSRRGRKIKCRKCFIVGHNFRNCQTSSIRTPPPALTPPALSAPFDPTLLAPFQTVAFEASISSPSALSAQLTPPTIPTSSAQQILTRLRSRKK
ncbi:hypothetical protein PVK06_019855 [Gossypium arboreum]|uniref:Uncharacterized protein n=1 Tax=Gossypium arboreum TaxID=29729 RepID=A0ABR0PKT5_GOSAR|nr:hypothetical protein PVK06_019855 [Gossypium arboreum]